MTDLAAALNDVGSGYFGLMAIKLVDTPTYKNESAYPKTPESN